MTALVDGYDSKNAHAVEAGEPRDNVAELRAKVRELVHERDRWQTAAEHATAELETVPSCRWSIRCDRPGCRMTLSVAASSYLVAAAALSAEIMRDRWWISDKTARAIEEATGRSLGANDLPEIVVESRADLCFAHAPR